MYGGKDVLVVRGGGPVDSKCDRAWRWWNRQRATIFLCLFSVYIILRIGLWVLDFSTTKDSNMFFLETRAKKMAIVIPFREDDIDRLTNTLRYGWRMATLKCFPLPEGPSSSSSSSSYTSWAHHPCATLSPQQPPDPPLWFPDDRFLVQKACDSAKGYGYFIDLIFYLDGNFEDLTESKLRIDDAIADNSMLRNCFETLIFLSSRSDMGDLEDRLPPLSSSPPSSHDLPENYMFLKLTYLFKLSELAYNAYDYFFWMPLDVQPIRDYWIDGIYEQVTH
jgi:hypothetical protein